MNRESIALTAAVMVILAGTLAGCQAVGGGAATTPSGSASSGSTSDTGSVLPVASNPISNASTAAGLAITLAAVEDNFDPATKKPIDDRLQLTLANSTSAPLTGVEIYYEMTDMTTRQSEGYYMPLDAVTIPANGETTVYFDNESGPGHFPENQFSLYRSSVNQVDFTIEASVDGLAIATATASKEAGTGEEAD